MIIKIFQIKEHIEIPVDQSIQEKYLQVVLIFITLKMVNNLMIKKLGISAVKGKDIDHKDGNPNNNSISNLRVMSKSKNRSKK